MGELFIFYGLAIISIIITLGAQAFISSCYSKYSKVKNEKGLTGSEVARKILDRNGLSDIKVVETTGYLSDHYDPKARTIRLSQGNFGEGSIAAVSVACHECGHAIQDKNKYLFLRIRSFLVPFVNFCSYAGYIAIVVGSEGRGMNKLTMNEYLKRKLDKTYLVIYAIKNEVNIKKGESIEKETIYIG